MKLKIELPLCLKRPKGRMSPEEAQIQRALGLLNDWIVSIRDREELFRLGTYGYVRMEDPTITIVVEAVSREHALEQVRQTNILSKEDLMHPFAYESNVYGAYCREHYREDLEERYHRWDERIYIL